MTEPAEHIQSRANRLVEDHFNLLRALIDMREEHELTQREVGERMGVSQATVAKFERSGSNPTLATIRRYAIAVGAILDTQVIDDCGERRATGADFYELVQPTGLAPSNWLNYKKISSVRLPSSSTKYVEPIEQAG